MIDFYHAPMKNPNFQNLILIVSLALLSPLLASSIASSPEVDLTGIWRGVIDPDGSGIELVFHIESSGETGWRGTVDTPAQNSFGLPLSGVSAAADGSVTFEVAATGGIYEAKLEPDQKGLRGSWKQRGAELTLDCEREPLPPPVPADVVTALPGIWEGVLPVGSIKLRIILKFEATDGNTLSGFMVSPDQSPAEVAITRIDRLDDRMVRVCLGEVFVRMELALSGAGDQLDGTFHQGRGKFDISLSKQEQVSEVLRPQEPKPPFPYRSEEVSYPNEAAGIKFAGTLTIPEGDGPFPSVLLITGSGGQDRDEAIFQHRPFFVIADHLSRRGIAVLRVDDRGVGETTRGTDPEKETTVDYVGDVLCGIEFLKGRSEVESKRIGLIGHSEGGVIAPLAAVASDDVAFIIMMAGTGIRGDQLLLKQNELISLASGIDEQEIARGLDLSRQLFALLLEDDLDAETTRSRMEAIVRASPDLSDGEDGDAEVARVIGELELPWIHWFVRYDPAPTIEQVTCPVLAVIGTLDLQVPCKDNLEAIGAALERGKNPDFELVEFAGLNHLFQHCDTGSPSEYGEIEETFSIEVLEKMTKWILHRFGNNKERKGTD